MKSISPESSTARRACGKQPRFKQDMAFSLLVESQTAHRLTPPGPLPTVYGANAQNFTSLAPHRLLLRLLVISSLTRSTG